MWRRQRRPIPGNPASDRMRRGPDCNRHSRVCADASTPFTGLPRRYLPTAIGMRFRRHDGIYRSDVVSTPKPNPGNGTNCLPPIGPATQVKERVGRTTLFSSSAMSSGRLFLDRVARQHCPSPLRRQGHHKTMEQRTKRIYHRTARCGLTGCLTFGVHRNTALARMRNYEEKRIIEPSRGFEVDEKVVNHG